MAVSIRGRRGGSRLGELVDDGEENMFGGRTVGGLDDFLDDRVSAGFCKCQGISVSRSKSYFSPEGLPLESQSRTQNCGTRLALYMYEGVSCKDEQCMSVLSVCMQFPLK